jgi:hypothetical protein
MSPPNLDVKKLGKELAKFATDGGDIYCRACMRLWESLPPDDKNYALYKEALKLLYKTPLGQEYARIYKV